MRLAVIETSSQGGLLHYAVQLADALAERGNAVDLVVPAHNELAGHVGPARRREILPAPTPPEGRLSHIRLLRRARVACRLLHAWGRINWQLRRGRYEAAIVTSDVDLWPMAVAVLLTLATRGGTRVAGICHSVRPLNRWAGDDMFARSSLLSRLLARMYARMDVVFVHGESSRSEFEATWPAGHLVVIPHGDERIFSGRPPAPSEQKRALFFGEWRKVKGLDVLMEAFERLLARNPEVRLTIAGAPCPVDLDPDVVREWAARQGDAVEVIDRYVPVEEVARLFGAARAVVTPYLVAYQSGVVHLAMTMERAVVASEVGDLISVVLDGETGLTVPPADPDALADALERVLEDGDLARRLGGEGRRRLLAGSSWELVAERIEAALSANV
ncbi:MAG: glycosyltransferase family 4 protein [Arthrospira platensis]